MERDEVPPLKRLSDDRAFVTEIEEPTLDLFYGWAEAQGIGGVHRYKIMIMAEHDVRAQSESDFRWSAGRARRRHRIGHRPRIKQKSKMQMIVPFFDKL